MRIEIYIDGNKFETPDTEEATAEEVRDAIYEDLERLEKIKFDLKGGGFLLLGPDAVKKAVLVIRV